MKPRPNRLCATTEHDGLVFRVAKRFHWGLRQCGIDWEDLVQAGRIGVVRAQKTFDPSRGIKFSTYASWWIRHYMRRESQNHARIVRIPVHAELNARQEGKDILPRRVGLEPFRIEDSDAPDRTTLDTSGHVTQPVAEEEAAAGELRDALEKAMATLMPRERDIIIGRIEHERTLASLGESHGITRERARQIQNRALKKLKHELRRLER